MSKLVRRFGPSAMDLVHVLVSHVLPQILMSMSNYTNMQCKRNVSLVDV